MLKLGACAAGSFNATPGYVLRSLLPPALRRAACPEPAPLSALAMVVLAVIHLDGGTVGEGACGAHMVCSDALLGCMSSRGVTL